MPFSKFRKEVEALLDDRYRGFLEKPREGQADLALPCFRFSGQLGRPPNEIAKFLEIEIGGKLRQGSLVRGAVASGPYLNFYVNNEKFASLVLKEIIRKKEKYGGSSIGKGKTVIVEYSSPNISKPMSVGHLRNTILGQVLYNIYKFLGYRTVSDNHLGDWGTQFGNLLYAYDRWGDEKKVKKNPIKELLALYVRFHEEVEKDREIEEEGRKWFKKLENGDREATALWKQFYKRSVEEFNRTYKRLNVKFDTMVGESTFVKSAKQIARDALEKGVAKEEEGTVIIPMDSTPIIIQKSDESTIYASRDLATLKYRMEKYRPWKILYVVGSEQSLYFRQVFYAGRLLGYVKGDEPVHVSYGLVSLPTGKMSTRLGRVVFIEDFLDEAVGFAKKVIEEKNPKLKKKEKVAEQIALAAVRYNDLSKQRTKNTVFVMKEAISFEGDTGPYLQYTAVRAASVLGKSMKKMSTKIKGTTEDEAKIAKELALFPGVVEDACRDCQPHYIANYLYRLASQFNEYYHKTRIIGTREEGQRLVLVLSVFTVLKTGLSLLGIEVPEKM